MEGHTSTPTAGEKVTQEAGGQEAWLVMAGWPWANPLALTAALFPHL